MSSLFSSELVEADLSSVEHSPLINKDIAATRRYVDMMATDAETPASTRARIDVLSALIAADGKS